MFFLVPFFMALFFSFTNLKISMDAITKTGFFQYKSVLTDADFWSAMRTTVIWTVAMMIGNNLFGVLMAILLVRLSKGRRIFLALLFWPTLVSAVVGSEITKTVFSADATGLVNMLIGLFGAKPVAWFEREGYALFSLMVMPFLFGFSIKMIIYYTSVMSIPSSYFEAARLETGSYSKIVRHITLPLIKNAFVLNILLSLIDGLKVLGPMQLITKGANGTQSSILYIYDYAFGTSSNMGKAAAAAFIVFAFILLASVGQLLISGKGSETYE
jgi:ABC-type sugar transport system permease subunit